MKYRQILVSETHPLERSGVEQQPNDHSMVLDNLQKFFWKKTWFVVVLCSVYNTNFRQVLYISTMCRTRICIGVCFWFVCCRSSSCFQGSCYYLGPKSSWQDAVSYCADTGGVLTSIRSYKENQFLSGTFLSICRKGETSLHFGCWIGMNDISNEGSWEWYDGITVNYLKWYNAEPNNYGGNEDCTAMIDGGYWSDKQCDNLMFPICKFLRSPTQQPTLPPSQTPTPRPSHTPTPSHSEAPTNNPTPSPSEAPTDNPTGAPTVVLTALPSNVPTEAPTTVPTSFPSNLPTEAPATVPTSLPTITEARTAMPSMESALDRSDESTGKASVIIFMIMVTFVLLCLMISLVMRKNSRRIDSVFL